ncbi:MAG: hypothetical protein H8E56_00605 [Candidatus Marinimicrobia bacterium]|nr:hypothetical protein [Candidatus Neomarinimicrobiota bacterium]
MILITGSFAQFEYQLHTISEFSNNRIDNIPFWVKMNRWGTPTAYKKNTFNSVNISLLRDLSQTTQFIVGIEGAGLGQRNHFVNSELYIQVSHKWLTLLGGRRKNTLGENDLPLSLGSMVVGSNALPIPRVSLSIPEYLLFKIGKIPLKIKGGFSHGWMDKGMYLEAPNLHEKWLYLSYEKDNYSGHLGLVHEAIWGGSTHTFGPQPTSFEDYLRVFFLLSGSGSSTSKEQTNALGNHLGMWDLGFKIKKDNYNYHLYLQHPFEDQSGARWLLNYPDGLWGMSIHSKNKKAGVTDFLLELLYTMHQSGSEEVSDSTYGWDDYYNNYLYRGGWVYKGNVIGNPMLTLGQNEIRDWTHIVNNRIIAFHSGIEGNILTYFQYMVLLTYSKNYGNYHDRDRSMKRGIEYDYEGGLNQLSYRVDLKTNKFLSKNNMTVTLSFIGDRGDLYEDNKMIMIGIDWYYSTITNKQRK